MKSLILIAVMSCAFACHASSEIVDGVTWTYSVSNGKASVYKSSGSPAIPVATKGALTIPAMLGGCPVTSIGDYAFYNCSGLTSVTIPEGVTSIGDSAFRGCSGLTSVTIPTKVTSIGDFAFSDCSGLTSVTIPEGVTSIGDCAFYKCSRLTSVTIPSSVTSIGKSAFYGCSGLTSVTIPTSVTSIGDSAFDGTPFHNNQPDGMVMLGGGVLYEYKGECPSSVAIPTSVTSIGDRAFFGCSGLTSVTIPSSVTSIGDFAFSRCDGLMSVAIPEGVTSVGFEAFSVCNGLTSVTIPSSVTSIGGSAFYKCSGLTSVTIPEGVTSIGYGAFSDCSGLTSVTIPSSVTSIGNCAFSGCSGLTSVTIPEGVTSIGDNAFYECNGLTSVTIPSSVMRIGDFAFSRCDGLMSVAIPEGVTSVGFEAFSVCNGLTSVTIPSSVTSICGRVFCGCDRIKSAVIPNGLTNVWTGRLTKGRRLRRGGPTSRYAYCERSRTDMNSVDVVKLVFGREGRLLPSTNGMTTVVFEKSEAIKNAVVRAADAAKDQEARKVRAAQRSQFCVGSSTAEFGRKRDALFMDIVREAEICQTNLAEYATYPYLPDAMSVVSNFCEKEGCVVVDVGHHFGAWRQGCGKKAYVVTCNMEDSSRFVPCGRSEGTDGFRMVSRDGAHTNVAYCGVGPICCYDAEGRFEAMYDSVDKLPGMQDCLAADLKCNYEEQDRWMAAHGFSDAETGRDAERNLDAARTNMIVRLGTLRTILSKFPQWKAGNRWYQVCDVRADLSCPSPAPEINTNDTVFVKMNERFENLGRSQDQLIEEFVRVLTGLKFGSSTDTNGVLDLKFNLGSYETCAFGVSDGGAINHVTLIAELDPSCEMNTIHEKLDQGLSTLASAIGLDRDALTYEGSEKGSGLRRPGNQDWKSVQSFSQRFTITRERLFGGYEYVVRISDSRNNARRPGGLLGPRPGLLGGGSLRERRPRRLGE